MKVDIDAAARLRALCAECGTQAKAAQRLGVSQQIVCDLLKGRRPFSDRVLEGLGLRRTVIVGQQRAS